MGHKQQTIHFQLNVVLSQHSAAAVVEVDTLTAVHAACWAVTPLIWQGASAPPPHTPCLPLEILSQACVGDVNKGHHKACDAAKRSCHTGRLIFQASC